MVNLLLACIDPVEWARLNSTLDQKTPVNKRARRLLPLAAALSLTCSSVSCYATAEWEYKAGQVVNVDQGLSPDRRYAIAATEDATGKFSLLLIDGITRKRIGPLMEVTEPLDTAPEAFHAEWAPDSRHVAIWYRTDRHIQNLFIYRIENRRAYPVTGPDLLNLAARTTSTHDLDIHSAVYSVKWRDAGHFAMSKSGNIRLAEGDKTTITALGKFGRFDSDAPNDINFSIDAVCELANDDRYRVLSFVPGAFWKGAAL